MNMASLVEVKPNPNIPEITSGDTVKVSAKIVEGEIEFLIFFWDPLEPQPHDPDVKALLRLAVLYNIPTASNRAAADFLISSLFMSKPYELMISEARAYNAVSKMCSNSG